MPMQQTSEQCSRVLVSLSRMLVLQCVPNEAPDRQRSRSPPVALHSCVLTCSHAAPAKQSCRVLLLTCIDESRCVLMQRQLEQSLRNPPPCQQQKQTQQPASCPASAEQPLHLTPLPLPPPGMTPLGPPARPPSLLRGLAALSLPREISPSWMCSAF